MELHTSNYTVAEYYKCIGMNGLVYLSISVAADDIGKGMNM